MNLTIKQPETRVLYDFIIKVGLDSYKVAEPEHQVIDLFKRYKKNGFVLDASGLNLIPFHAIDKIETVR